MRWICQEVGDRGARARRISPIRVLVIGPSVFEATRGKAECGPTFYLGACGGVDKRLGSLLGDLFYRETVTCLKRNGPMRTGDKATVKRLSRAREKSSTILPD